MRYGVYVSRLPFVRHHTERYEQSWLVDPLRMNRARLDELLNTIRTARVAVLGDFALDACWTLDHSASELSLETGKPTWPVRAQRYELGGAANVVHNLHRLGVKEVRALGVVGNDPFGRELKRRLDAIGVDTSGLTAQAEAWDTLVFGKPYADGVEQSRLDFGTRNQPTPEIEQKLVTDWRETVPRVDGIILNQQARHGVWSNVLTAAVNQAIAAHRQRIFVVDSRDHSEEFSGAILKVNELAARRLAGTGSGRRPTDEWERLARKLHGQTGQPVFITRGAQGLVAYDGRTLTAVAGIRVPEPVDPVGAGDAATAALTAALCAGASVAEAAELANLAAAVTVTKIQRCGTATPEEIVMLADRCTD